MSHKGRSSFGAGRTYSGRKHKCASCIAKDLALKTASSELARVTAERVGVMSDILREYADTDEIPPAQAYVMLKRFAADLAAARAELASLKASHERSKVHGAQCEVCACIPQDCDERVAKARAEADGNARLVEAATVLRNRAVSLLSWGQVCECDPMGGCLWCFRATDLNNGICDFDRAALATSADAAVSGGAAGKGSENA